LSSFPRRCIQTLFNTSLTEWFFALVIVLVFLVPSFARAAVWEGAGDGNNDHVVPIMDCILGNPDYRGLFEMTAQDGMVTEREQELLAINCQNIIRLVLAGEGPVSPQGNMRQYFEWSDSVLTKFLRREQRRGDQAQ